MNSANAKHWKAAMLEEISSLKNNDTFSLATLPESRKAVEGKWVFIIKDVPGKGKIYKARFVAKGYSQVKDIDYYDTIAPTANMCSCVNASGCPK